MVDSGWGDGDMLQDARSLEWAFPPKMFVT